MKDEEISLLSELEVTNWWNYGRQKILHSVLSNIHQKSSLKIFDVGCGPGGTTLSFLKFGDVFGTDFSTFALKKAKEKGLQNVFRSTLSDIPIKNQSFDVITALDVIEHVEHDLIVLHELKRILTSNGYLIITVPAFQFLWSEHDVALLHFRRYNKHTLSKVLDSSGFEIIKMSYFVSFLFPFVAIYRLLSKIKITSKKPKANEGKFPKPINDFFKKIMEFENKLLTKFNLPFGISLLCVVKKKY